MVYFNIKQEFDLSKTQKETWKRLKRNDVKNLPCKYNNQTIDYDKTNLDEIDLEKKQLPCRRGELRWFQRKVSSVFREWFFLRLPTASE